MAAVGSTRNSSKTMSDLHSAATRCGSKIVITYSDVIAGYNRGAGGAGRHIVVFELPSAPGVRETEYVKAAHILAISLSFARIPATANPPAPSIVQFHSRRMIIP